MKIPNIARYPFVYQKVVDFFFDFNICNFPVQIIDIIEEIPNCILCTYKEFISAFGNNNPAYIQKRIKTEDGFIMLQKGYYYIVYNDKIEIGRRNFTLAHELGHLYLGHLTDFDETLLSRGGLTKASYKVLENEANAFARNILAPITIIDEAHLLWATVQNVFDVTYKASNSRYSFANRDRVGIGKFNAELLKEHFAPFLNRKFCFNCHNVFVSEGNYCPVCSSQNTSWDCKVALPFDRRWDKFRYIKGVDYEMKYPSISVDENSKALICPKCNNEEIIPEGKFCKICGENLINFCEGFIDDDGNHLEEGCGKLLPGNARYCPYCGAVSHFYNRGFLQSWESSQESISAEEAFGSSNNSPFDEEIPF